MFINATVILLCMHEIKDEDTTILIILGFTR